MPTEEEIAASGFSREDYEEEVDVWPENWHAVDLFRRFNTQWRIGMKGPTGLVYEAVFALLDRKGYAEAEWWQMFNDIQVMEVAALKAMRTD